MQSHGSATADLTFPGPINPVFEDKRIEKQW